MNRYLRLTGCALLAALAWPPRCPSAFATINPVTAPPVAAVNGFRSAQFGMGEAAVRRCIASDFNPQTGAVQSVVDPQNKTEAISVQVPRLIAGLGKANVAYILGYRSHRLMEVVVVWSGTADPANTGPAIISAAQELHSYFLSEGFPNAAVKLSQPGQILMFHGKDAQGHAILIELQGKMSKPDAKHRQSFAPTALIVGYSQDPDHPDVFSLPKGAF